MKGKTRQGGNRSGVGCMRVTGNSHAPESSFDPKLAAGRLSRPSVTSDELLDVPRPMD